MSDICLLLEGTYPYVRGGVSSWVHQMITKMPDIKFSLLSIMPSPSFTREEKYPIPQNVESIINVYIHDFSFKPRLFETKNPEIFKFFDMFFRGIEEVPQEELEQFLMRMTKNKDLLDNNYIFTSGDFWKAVVDMYNNADPSLSFVDFFWNYRFTFLPIVQILKTEIPPAPLYHTISTGYAGVLASLAKTKYNSNMILTEHGIYTKERRIEIAQSSWIYEMEEEYIKATAELGFFKKWWIQLFAVMSRLCYTYADEITTLYEGNRQTQLKDGADPKKTSIIPNGINIEGYRIASEKRKKKEKRRTIAFVGRIVPIKDVKTLIKAIKIIVERYPDMRVLFMGPQEEESQYYQECVILIRMLGLEKKIVFTGHVDTKEYYPTIDIIILTSISEAQPLVILEAAACGVPSVATDVGSCTDMLNGIGDEDRAIGQSGLICPFYSPDKTAEAVFELIEDDELYAKMSAAAITRARKYYDESDMIVKYKNLYEKYI